jgi:hypothetical protein
VHLAADVDRDGQCVTCVVLYRLLIYNDEQALGWRGRIDGNARKVGQVVIKKKKVNGLAARCMFGSSGGSNASDSSPDAVCIRTCKPFTVSVWSAGDFSLRDCPLSLMVLHSSKCEILTVQNLC